MNRPHLLLRRSLSAPFPPPSFPADIRLVPFENHYALAAYALLSAAYARGGGGVPSRFVDWWTAVSTDEEFDPSLCFVALDANDHVAGFALCWTSSFIKDIAVADKHRRRGIAEALLLATFATLKDRGHAEVRLKVEMDNPSGAQRLYERLGFLMG